MKLNIQGETTIDNPSDNDIRKALYELDADAGDAFVILEQDDLNYIQTSGDRNMGFVVEYQKENTNNHYQSKNCQILIDEVVRALICFRDGSDEWLQKIEFEKMTW